jgi:chemotaxis protein CheZ
LLNAFGDELKRDGAAKAPEKKTKAPSGAPARPDEDLLNGPQLPENAASQDDIDALVG